jgi:hypothetical protein
LKTADEPKPEPGPETPVQTEEPAADTQESLEALMDEALAASEPASVPAEADDAFETLKQANDLIAALYEENQALEEETEPSLMKGIKQIVESPEMQGMIRAGMSDEVKRSHGALFRRLGLNPEQEAAMTDLIIAHGMKGIETGIHWMTGNLEESSAQTVAAREELHGEIEKLLGPERLAMYKYWEDTKNERESVQKFNRNLGEEPLDEETSDQLVDMMFEERVHFEELDYLSRPENFDPKEMTPEYREDIMGQVEELHEVYVEEAAPMLTEDQLTSYESSLSRQRKELDGFLKFTHAMFNRGEEPGGASEPNEP